MKTVLPKISVFCASSDKIDQKYFDHAHEVGALLAKNGFHLYFGGGGKGLMAAVADASLRNGGIVTGVIPHFMVKEEWQHRGVENMICVNSMSERKKLLIEHCDGILILPGSIGTFEEFMEVLSMKKLGLFFAPIVILNTNNYYNPLIEMLMSAIDEHFMRTEHAALWSVAETPEMAIKLLKETPAWPENALKFAST